MNILCLFIHIRTFDGEKNIPDWLRNIKAISVIFFYQLKYKNVYTIIYLFTQRCSNTPLFIVYWEKDSS